MKKAPERLYRTTCMFSVLKARVKIDETQFEREKRTSSSFDPLNLICSRHRCTSTRIYFKANWVKFNVFFIYLFISTVMRFIFPSVMIFKTICINSWQICVVTSSVTYELRIQRVNEYSIAKIYEFSERASIPIKYLK